MRADCVITGRDCSARLAGNLHAPQRGMTNPYEFAISVVRDGLDGLTQSLDAFMFGARFGLHARARCARVLASVVIKQGSQERKGLALDRTAELGGRGGGGS